MSRIARPSYLVAVQESKKRSLLFFRARSRYYRPINQRLSDLLYSLPAWVLLIAAASLIAAIGYLDFATGAELSFLPFYLLPVALVTWYVGRKAGWAVAGAGALVWGAGYITAEVPNWDTWSAYWNLGSRIGIFLMVVLTMSGMKRALDSEKHLARTDPVTGVSNSRAYNERVEQAIFYSRRYKRPFTGVYIDVDNFKSVNDHFGHSVGDFCLKVVADTIRANTRVTDFPSRIAGDEFAILMPETSSEQSRVVIARLREKLLDAMRQNGWPATFSIGVATYMIPPENADELIKLSDDLMYWVKNNGKDGVRYEIFGLTDPPTPQQKAEESPDEQTRQIRAAG